MSGKFEIKKTKNDKFMFNLKAANGQVILTSQMYTEKSAAKTGIESVRTNCGDDGCFDRRTSSADEPYFVMVAGNKQEIGKSEMYSSASAMENGISSVKTNAPEAAIEDLA